MAQDGAGRSGAFVDAVAPPREDAIVSIGDDRADGQRAGTVSLQRLLHALLQGFGEFSHTT